MSKSEVRRGWSPRFAWIRSICPRICPWALLLASQVAAAACFVHPETGVQHCTSAGECAPPATVWSHTTQACSVPAIPVPTAATSGSFTPGVYVTGNVAALTIRKAVWSRQGDVVTVSGGATFQARIPGTVRIVLDVPVPAAFVGDGYALSGTFSSQDGISGTLEPAGNVAALLVTVPDTGFVSGRYVYVYHLIGSEP